MSGLTLTVGLCNVLIGITSILVGIPLWRRRVPMNRTYGIRMGKAFDSDEAWYAINEHGGKRLVIYGIPVLIAGITCFLIAEGGSPAPKVLLAFVPCLLFAAAADSSGFANNWSGDEEKVDDSES
ncbi:MAG: SdpI family protein [Verrucomicrobiota bacterium]